MQEYLAIEPFGDQRLNSWQFDQRAWKVEVNDSSREQKSYGELGSLRESEEAYWKSWSYFNLENEDLG